MTARTIAADLFDRPSGYQLALVVGAGCMLAVLMAALSGVTASKAGMSYTDPMSLVFTLVLYVALFALFPLARRSWFRRALAVASALLCAAWMAGMGVVAMVGAAGVPETAQVLFGFVGRAFGIPLAFLWNLCFCLQRPLGAVPMVTASVLLAAALFLLASLLDGAASILVVGLLGLASAFLCLWVEVNETSRAEAPHSLESVARLDSSYPLDRAPAVRTRALYFGSRALYSLLAGLVIGVASAADGGGARPGAAASLLLSLVLLLMVGASLALRSELPTRLGRLLGTPFVVVAFVVASFAGADGGEAGVVAMLIEIVWSVQLYAQLPSYRAMVKMDPAVFAWVDKALAMVLYMGAMNLVSLRLARGPVGAAPALALAGTGLALVTVFAVLSLVRHVLRYYPMARSAAAPAPAPGPTRLDAVGRLAEERGLTAKEREVAYYLSLGYSRPYIGKVLYITGGTVKIHTHHIYQKLGVSSQDELIELVQRALEAEASPGAAG